MELPAEVIEARKSGRRWPMGLVMWAMNGTFTDAQWDQARNDGRQFLSDWAHQAAALGWTEENALGLIWSLQGRRVVGMTARRAAIIDGSGKVTFYRRFTAD